MAEVVEVVEVVVVEEEVVEALPRVTKVQPGQLW